MDDDDLERDVNRDANRDVRAAIRRQRWALTPGERHRVAAGLRDVFLGSPWLRRMRCVALYEPDHDGAPDTRLLAAALTRRGVVVLALRPDLAGSPRWESGLVGLPALPVAVGWTPARTPRLSPLRRPDVVVVPALAVDTLGHRLAALDDDYAPLLRRLPHATPALVAVHDDEIVDAALGSLPGFSATGATDDRLTAALTPTRLLRLGSDLHHAYLAASC